MSWGWFDKLFPFRRKDPPFRIPLIRTLIGKFRKSRVNPVEAASSSNSKRNRENWPDSTTLIIPLSEFPFSPDNKLNQFHLRKDGQKRSSTKSDIKQAEEKKKETPFTSPGTSHQNLQPFCVASISSSSSSSSVVDGSLSRSSSSSPSSTSIFFVHDTNPSTEPTTETAIVNQIQNQEEITTYLSHLDEPTTIILISNNELNLDDNNNNNTILLDSDPVLEIIQEQKNVDTVSSDVGVKTPEQKENNKNDNVKIVQVLKPVEKVKTEDKRIKDGLDVKLVKEKVWANIDTILKHFGHTFLDRVAHAIMLLNCTQNRLSRKLSRSDVLDMLTQPKNGRLAPKIIVMIDDPPKSREKNCSLGRLLCVKLYLLQVQFFVIPCFDLSLPVLHSMTNRLIEDKSSKCRNFKMAYNFILELGFSTLLKRNDADVIVFDGDWNNQDVCGLINHAEKSGHELMFMKNHQGIKRTAFVNVIISKIQTKLNEFEELKAAESQTSSYTPNSKRSKTSSSPQNHNEKQTPAPSTTNQKRLDVLQQYKSGIIRLSNAYSKHNNDNDNVNNDDNDDRQKPTTTDRENHYSRLQPYYAFMKLDPETISKLSVVDATVKKSTMNLDNPNSKSNTHTRGTRKKEEVNEDSVENNNNNCNNLEDDEAQVDNCNENTYQRGNPDPESESRVLDSQIPVGKKRSISGVRRTQSWS